MRRGLDERLARSRFALLRDIVNKRPSSGANLTALDGLRGLAVLMVLAGHADGFGFSLHGGVGVWLFFTLSAFLLTLPFAANAELARTPSYLRKYLIRRIARIVPLYYFVLTVRYLFEDWEHQRFVDHLIFIRADRHYWSIPQELLFYLCLPLVVALLAPLIRRSKPFAALAGGVIGLAFDHWVDGSIFSLYGNWNQLPFWFLIFVTGMSFAFLYRWGKLSRFATRRWVNHGLHIFGLAILPFIFFTSPHYLRKIQEIVPSLQQLQVPLAWSVEGFFGLVWAILIWICLQCEGKLLHRIMSSLLLRSVGLVSFSMYILHWAVQQRLEDLGFKLGGSLFLATLVVTFLISSVTYTLIERPFVRGSAAMIRGSILENDPIVAGTR